MFDLWEFGVLLIGVGFFSVCIYASISLSSFNKILLRVDKNIQDNEKEIKSIVNNVNEVSVALGKIATIGNNCVGFFSAFKFFTRLFK